MPSPMDEEWYPHYMDSPADIAMLAAHPFSLPYMAYETPRAMYAGEYSREDTERAMFRTAVWGGLTGTAMVANRLTTGKWGAVPKLTYGAAALSGMRVPWLVRAGTAVGGAFWAALELNDLFLDPSSNYYIPPDAPLISFQPGSVWAHLGAAAYGTFLHLVETAV